MVIGCVIISTFFILTKSMMQHNMDNKETSVKAKIDKLDSIEYRVNTRKIIQIPILKPAHTYNKLTGFGIKKIVIIGQLLNTNYQRKKST